MMRLDREKLGAALREAREGRMQSVRDIAVQTGVSKSAISRAERGHADGYVTADAAIVLSQFFGIDPRRFVEVFHGNTPSGQTLREFA